MKKTFFFGVNLILVVSLILQAPLYTVAVTEETADTEEQTVTDSRKDNSEDNTAKNSNNENATEGNTRVSENSNETESMNENATEKDTESSSSETEENKEYSEKKFSVMAANTITTGTWGTASWSFDSTTGTLTFGGGALGVSSASPWRQNIISASLIKSIVFTKQVSTPSNSTYLFSNGNYDAPTTNTLINCTTINGISYLDTSNTNNMSYMFSNMQSLVSLDLSNFVTSNVKNMELMFFRTHKLISLELKNFNTSKVTNMWAMFNYSGLKNLDVASFNTANVTNMESMFAESSIIELNLSNFSSTKLTRTWNMFGNMLNLTKLDISNLNISNVTDTNKTQMFINDTKLNSLTIGSGFKDIKNVTKLPDITVQNGYTGNWILSSDTTSTSVGTTAQFLANYDGTKQGTYVWQQQLWGTVPWSFDSTAGTLTLVGGGSLGNYNTSPWNRTDSLKVNSLLIKKIIFTDNVVAPKDSRYLFGYPNPGDDYGKLRYFESFEGLNKLDTTNVTMMNYMFAYLGRNSTVPISSLDVSSFNTTNVTDMSKMFCESNIASLDLSSFITTRVTKIDDMFGNADSLVYLNLSSFDFSNIINTDITTSKFLRTTKELKEIVLPTTFRDSLNVSQLPNIQKSATYSGNWEYQETGTTVGTTSQFLANYDGTNPGTYVWESATDPLDPTDTTQTTLILNTVPTSFNFSTTLKNGSYAITNNLTTDNAITVSNKRLDRDWSVKASVVDTKLTLEKDTTQSLSLQSFSINGKDLLATGSNGIVANSESTKTLDNNVGSLTTSVNSISLGFSDSNGILIAGDNLKGTVRYQLYNTVSAE